MPSFSLPKSITPVRLVLLLGLLTVGCAFLIAEFSIDENRTGGESYAVRAQRLTFVHEAIDAADNSKLALREYEVTQKVADRDAFLKSCDFLANKVTGLRQAEHMSDEQSDEIVDLCVAIRQQLNKLDSSPADRMSQASFLVDRVRRVVLGFGMDELRQQDEKLQAQAKAATLNRNMTVGMAIIEIFLVAALVFLTVRLTRLEQLVTVCAWSHRLFYEGQWVSLEKYLEERFGVRASEGISTEQAAKLMSEGELNTQELVRLVEFERAAGEHAAKANKMIHGVRNHLTAVLCYSEMAGSGDQEAQREMSVRVANHAATISSQIEELHRMVRSISPVAPNFTVLPKAGEAKAA